MSVELVCPHCNALNRLPAEKLNAGPVCGKCKGRVLPGQVVSATDTTLGRYIDRHGLPVVVDFWASWCGPCRQFAPVFSDVASENTARATFLKLDTESNPQSAARFQIRSIPTLMVFHQGRELGRLSGACPNSSSSNG